MTTGLGCVVESVYPTFPLRLNFEFGICPDLKN